MIRLNLPPMLDLLGSFPLEDIHGMPTAIAVLDRSLDKGLYESQVQWEASRKQRSHITNAHQASRAGLTDVVEAYERNRCWGLCVGTTLFVDRRMGDWVGTPR